MAQLPETSLVRQAVASLPGNEFTDDVMFLRYRLNLTKIQHVRIVFNSRQDNCIWLNGEFCFGRESGPVLPSPHRSESLRNQHKDLHLDASEHEMIAAVCCPADSNSAEWIVIVADYETKQWIPDALMRERCNVCL